MDGVIDAQDQCPNTLLTDLVDTTGCTVESLISPHHYDIIVGTDYIYDDDKTFANTLQMDYYNNDFSLSLNTSYFHTTSTNDTQTGFYDTYLSGTYALNLQKDTQLHISAGIVLPTYQSQLTSNKIDYFMGLDISYTQADWNFFGAYSYTIIGDEVIVENNVTSQNTYALTLGAGYYLSADFYMNSSYNLSSSIYSDEEALQTLSFYGFYTINEKYFTTFSYVYGLSSSASKHAISFKIGYLF
jgi:hypothetical protein